MFILFSWRLSLSFFCTRGVCTIVKRERERERERERIPTIVSVSLFVFIFSRYILQQYSNVQEKSLWTNFADSRRTNFLRDWRSTRTSSLRYDGFFGHQIHYRLPPRSHPWLSISDQRVVRSTHFFFALQLSQIFSSVLLRSPEGPLPSFPRSESSAATLPRRWLCTTRSRRPSSATNWRIANTCRSISASRRPALFVADLLLRRRARKRFVNREGYVLP